MWRQSVEERLMPPEPTLRAMPLRQVPVSSCCSPRTAIRTAALGCVGVPVAFGSGAVPCRRRRHAREVQRHVGLRACGQGAGNVLGETQPFRGEGGCSQSRGEGAPAMQGGGGWSHLK